MESDELQDTGTHEGFVTYDELMGPDLDGARWSPARLPLPTGVSTSRWTPTRS